jgi:hypothetical protein
LIVTAQFKESLATWADKLADYVDHNAGIVNLLMAARSPRGED